MTLGRFCFIGGNSGVRKDLEPYISHNWSHRTLGEAGPACINEVGLRRNGFSAQTIQNLRTAYKVIFLRKEPFNEFGREVRLEIESRGGIPARRWRNSSPSASGSGRAASGVTGARIAITVG